MKSKISRSKAYTQRHTKLHQQSNRSSTKQPTSMVHIKRPVQCSAFPASVVLTTTFVGARHGASQLHFVTERLQLGSHAVEVVGLVVVIVVVVVVVAVNLHLSSIFVVVVVDDTLTARRLRQTRLLGLVVRATGDVIV